ncbi:MAG: hypothetical protein WD738_12265 [Pirellulales bacterium]
MDTKKCGIAAGMVVIAVLLVTLSRAEKSSFDNAATALAELEGVQQMLLRDHHRSTAV